MSLYFPEKWEEFCTMWENSENPEQFHYNRGVKTLFLKKKGPDQDTLKYQSHQNIILERRYSEFHFSGLNAAEVVDDPHKFVLLFQTHDINHFSWRLLRIHEKFSMLSGWNRHHLLALALMFFSMFALIKCSLSQESLQLLQFFCSLSEYIYFCNACDLFHNVSSY